MILNRTATASELKELHKSFQKIEKKQKKREQNKTAEPYGARTFSATSNSIKNPLREEKKKTIHCSIAEPALEMTTL